MAPDPRKCDTCLGYGNTHERTCPRFSKTVMDPCPSCVAHLERIKWLKKELSMATKSLVIKDARIRKLEDSDAWKLHAEVSFSYGTCPVCFCTDEGPHVKGCAWYEMESSLAISRQANLDSIERAIGAEQSLSSLREKLERTERLWSEDRAAVKDWAAASDAIGELYEILGITKDSAGFEDGFTKIVAAVKEKDAQLCRAREAGEQIDVVFDGPPSHKSGRFVEVENSEGKSISFGEWLQRSDGYWVLRFRAALSSTGPCAHEEEAKRLLEISKALALKALTVSAVSAHLVEAVDAAKRYREIVGIGRKPEDGALRAIEEFDEAYLAYREMMMEKPEEKPCLSCRKYAVIPGGFCPGCGAVRAKEGKG